MTINENALDRLSDYKKLEEKEVKVDNFLGPDKARSVVLKSMEQYQEKYVEQEPEPASALE